MIVGLIIAALLVVLGTGAGSRQLRTMRRVQAEPFMPDVDRKYFRGQGRRRLAASGLLVVIGLMIAFYYLSGMDARMDELGEKRAEGPPAEADKEFARLVGVYWIVVILLLGAVVTVAMIDFWATRVYWLARYREIKNDHNTKLQRDLAVYRQQKLNDRVKGLKKPTDDTTPEGEPPVG
ncbi:MAG: hypothetical protein C0467_09900 [Planctomycetaceae bacterium]|nr:hypothetical protein [Planctomycetaceae bacterium]